MNPKKHVTLQDIADHLHISKVTVSKALRDQPDISPETKRLVREWALKLGYVPDYNARNLTSRRTHTIGLVVPKIAHHFFTRAIEVIYETAYQHNYEIIMTVSQENADREIKHIQTLLSMRVDGLLVSITEQTSRTDIFDVVKKRGVPLVFFDRVIEDIGFSCVTANDFESTCSSMGLLLERGYRRMAHLAGSQNTNIGRNRLAGFQKAFAEKGLDLPPAWIVEGGFGEEDGYRGFKKLMQAGELPEVIFTVTSPVALGSLRAAEEAGINVPNDLEIISYGGGNYNRFMKPALSYIEQPVDEIGKTATRVLLEKIQSHEAAKIQNIEIPAKLVLCDTCLKNAKCCD